MVKKGKADKGIVYSTEQGRMCPTCCQPTKKCDCKSMQTVHHGDGIVRIGRQTKGRKGKGVTLITGLQLEPEKLKALAKKLKQKCGSGGSIKNGVIEIQGDHRLRLKDELIKMGCTVKLAGG